jgi:hypothetical protein
VTVALRWVSGFFITGAVPCEVIEETPDFAALYQPAGSIWKRAAGERTGPRGRNMVPEGRSGTHDDTEWLGDGVLRLHSFGDEWSVWRWLDSNRVWSDQFYVNLEDPWRRSPIGFDTGDWVLDVVGTPESWEYKDEDELQWSEDIGLVDDEWAARTRDAGRRASAALEANAWPFNADWGRWLPPIGVAVPVLPDEWDAVDQPGTGV